MKPLVRLFTFTKEIKKYYILIGFLSVLTAVIGMVQPLLSGWAIDQVRQGTAADITRVVVLVILIFVSDVGSTFVSNINGYYGDIMSQKVQQLLGARYYQHLLTLPQSYFDTELTGKIIGRLNRSIYQISSFLHVWSNNFLQFIFSTVIALGITAYYSWPVAALLATLYPILIIMTIKSSTKWQDYQSKINEQNDVASGRFAEAVSQVKVVKSFGRQQSEVSYFDKAQNKILKFIKPQSIHWHAMDIYRRLILNVIFLGVYLFIFLQAAHGQLTPGQAVSLVLYAMQIRIPIFTISFLVDNTQHAIADSKDYFEVMALKPAIADHDQALPLQVQKGRIVFDGVNFSYGDKPVLKGVSFAAEPDTKVALVGESGEGKTTLTNLLLRLYETDKGEITIDDQPVSSVTQASLRESIGVVFQEPALFSGTIRENITYGKSAATDKQVIAAAKAANAHEFITKLEKGYDTQIGERGLKLSGGQKQRIAIARALLKDAPILILDEATSSLDSKSEGMVQEALQRLMKGRTTLIIAHRLSTIQHVDQIVTLQNGVVDEVGTPAQLAKSGGIYAQLLALQRGDSETDKKKLKAYELAG